nr:WAT1-related protein At4g08300-like [Ziziphus jujuba var. spinosa]
MEIPIFLLYKYAIASMVLVPLVIVNRSTLPPLTWKILVQIITLGIVGPGLDNMFYAGVKVTPATFATCITSLVPALTFLGSWIFRLETVHIQERPSQAKLLGTAIMTTGAFVSGIYGGPIIAVASTSSTRIAAYLEYNWVRGPLFLLTSLLSAVAYNLLLDKTVKNYSAPLALAAYICCIGAVINMGYSFIREGTSGLEWLWGLNIKLGAYFYSGLFVSGLISYIQGRLTKLKGPVFFISFSPLSMIFVMVLGTLILKEDLKLGRLIGAFIIVFGLGILLWGKSQGSSPDEDQNEEEEEMEASSEHHDVEALEATQEEQILEDEDGLHELELAEEDDQASEPEEKSSEDDDSHHTAEVEASSGEFHIVELFETAEENEMDEGHTQEQK